MSPAAEPVGAFWSELADRSPSDPAVGAAVAAALSAAIARAHAAFPDLALDDVAFAQHLGRAVRAADVAPTALTDLAVEDLYLTGACLAGDPRAVSTLGARYGATVRAAIGRIVPAADAGEAEQHLMESLLVGNAASPPKLGTYSGKAPLDRWLSVAAQRTALMSLRAGRSETRAHLAAAAEPAGSGQTHPEIAFVKEKYRAEFERALADALGRLPQRDRVMLRLHLVNGVSVEKIGKMFSVSQPTASRWLAAAREALLADIKEALQQRLSLSSAELSSLAGMVASRIDLSLSVLLRTA